MRVTVTMCAWVMVLLLPGACKLIENPLAKGTDSEDDDTASSGTSGTTPPGVDTTAGSATGTGTEDADDTVDGRLLAHDDHYLIPGCRKHFPWSPPTGLLANDEADEEAMLSLVGTTTGTVAGGMVTFLDGGSFEYTPPATCRHPDDTVYTCEDAFSYTVTDQSGQVSSARVTLGPTTLYLDPTDNSGARFWPIDGKIGVLGMDHPSRAGVSVAAAGDFDDDGMVDIVIGAHRVPSAPALNVGEAYVLYGRPDRPPRLWLDALTPDDGLVIRGSQPNGFAGLAVAGAGDVDGDGASDVLVAAPGNDPGNQMQWNPTEYYGRVYLVYGGDRTDEFLLADLDATAPNEQVLLTGASPNDWVGVGLDGGVVFGSGAPDIADIDGDGVPDAAIGRPQLPDGPGRASWLYGSGQLDFDGVIAPPAVGYGFGYVVRILGDIDGDGLPELAGASDVSATLAGDQYAGRVSVWLSPASADPATQDVTDASATLVGEPGDRLGRGLADVDLDNDGNRDLAIGAPGHRGGGQVYVVYGGASLDLDRADLLDQLDSPAGAPALGLVIRGDHTDDADVGRALDDAGDFNGDGYRDLVIGTPQATAENLQECPAAGDGVTYVVFGHPPDQSPPLRSLDQITCGGPDPQGAGIVQGVAILPPLPEPELPDPEDSFCTGWSVAGIGDFDGDGCDDILIGAPTFIRDMPGGSSIPGRAYVVYGFDPASPDHACTAGQ